MLEIKGTYFPGYVKSMGRVYACIYSCSVSLDAVEKELKEPETSDDIRDRLKDMQQEHEDEMSRLLDRQVEDYFHEMQDAYLSKDDGIHIAEIEVAAPITIAMSCAKHIYIYRSSIVTSRARTRRCYQTWTQSILNIGMRSCARSTRSERAVGNYVRVKSSPRSNATRFSRRTSQNTTRLPAEQYRCALRGFFSPSAARRSACYRSSDGPGAR